MRAESSWGKRSRQLGMNEENDWGREFPVTAKDGYVFTHRHLHKDGKVGRVGGRRDSSRQVEKCLGECGERRRGGGHRGRGVTEGREIELIILSLSFLLINCRQTNVSGFYTYTCTLSEKFKRANTLT